MGKIDLTADQHKVHTGLSEIPEFTENYYFTGGTALSVVYLSHRRSDDLDYFTDKKISLDVITGWVKVITGKNGLKSASYEKTADRNIFYLPFAPVLKIEFTLYPYPPLDQKTGFLNIQTDSLKDIATNKLLALVDRNEPKDFVDLYYLIKQYPVADLINNVRQKFGLELTPLSVGTEMVKAGKKLSAVEIETDVNKEEMIEFFEAEAKKLGDGLIR